MLKRFTIVAVVLAFVLSACAPVATPTPEVQTVEVEVTRIAEITRDVVRTVQVTQRVTVEVTRLVEVPVTVTPTPTPLYTPTITPTPSHTPTPSATPNVAKTATAEALELLRAPRGDGFYLINVDIAPGVWRSTAGSDNCYWSRTRANGDIIDNHFGQSGGTAYIAPGDYQVEFKNCGRWEWLSAP